MGSKNPHRAHAIRWLWPRQRLWALVLMAGLGACGGSGSSFTNEAVQVPTQAVAIDVSSALVTPSYTLDGGPFPISEYDDGNVVLRSTTEADDIALLGSSHDPNPAAVRVVQDSYEVLFRHETGDGVPQNVDTPVQTTGAINADGPLAIGVTSWSVTPGFLQNGAAFPASEYDDANFYLRPAGGGENILLGNSHTASPAAVRVMAGTYDVIYALETGGDMVPGNQAAVIMSGVAVGADGPLNIDVSSGRLSFDATLDTVAFPNSQYQQAEFLLRNTSTGDSVLLGSSNALPITQLVVAGTYDIVYRHLQGDALPVNTDAIIATGVVVDSSGVSVSVDIESVAITPAFSLDGGAFPASEYDDANFYLRSMANSNDEMFIGASEVPPAPVRVISATDTGAGAVAYDDYEVLYRHESGTGVPQNANAVVLSNQTLDADGGLAVAVSSVSVTGRFTLNGSAFPADAGNSVRFLLRDAGNDSDTFLLGYSDLGNEAISIIPGSYHVVMDHFAGSGVPQNAMHEVDFNLALNADQTLTVNVPAVRVDPNFTLDGADFPASIYQSAVFYLRDRHGGGRIFLGYSYTDNEPVMVIKEDHEVIYEHLIGEQTPQNSNSLITVLDL